MHLLTTRPIWELKRSSLNAIILQKIIKRTWKNVIKVIQMPAEPKPGPRFSKSWSSGPFLLYQCDSSFYLTKQGYHQIAHPEKTTSHIFFKILIEWLLQVSHYARYYGQFQGELTMILKDLAIKFKTWGRKKLQKCTGGKCHKKTEKRTLERTNFRINKQPPWDLG